MTKPGRRIVSVCVVAGIGAILLLIAMQVLPAWRFRNTVLRPIPSSVKAVRADKTWGFNEHGYVFRFDIGKEDLQLLLKSRGFKPIGHVAYHNGTLEYGESSRATTSFSLYETYDGKYPPRWFKFDTWTDFQAYLAEKERREYYGVWLLLYREDIGQAYFIEREIWGKWGADLTHEEKRRKAEEDARVKEQAFEKSRRNGSE